MSHVRIAYILALTSGLSSAASAVAGSPFENLSLFKRLDADPAKSYPLTESQGPWLILAATYSGEDAEAQSKALVLELRREFKLPAYAHKMSWDFSEKVQGRGVDEHGRPKVMKYANYDRREEIAVLVGDFPTLDDPGAKSTLDKVRHIFPVCLDPEHLAKTGRKNARMFASWRWSTSQTSNDEAKKQRGPLGKAFMVNNPLLPDEYYKPKGVDPLVERMNERVEHSLLDCPGQYTIKVATFTGASTSIPREVEQIQKGERQLKSRLEQAALDAHNLTVALRHKGYEAYEFHDETESIVTVGNFAAVGTPTPDGKIALYPEVLRIMQDFGAVTISTAGGPPPGQRKELAGIPFDVSPLPIEVPRRSIAADYARPRVSVR